MIWPGQFNKAIRDWNHYRIISWPVGWRPLCLFLSKLWVIKDVWQNTFQDWGFEKPKDEIVAAAHITDKEEDSFTGKLEKNVTERFIFPAF